MKHLHRYFTTALLDAYPHMSAGLHEMLVNSLSSESFIMGDSIAVSTEGQRLMFMHCPDLLDLDTLTFPKEPTR
jgi:hypothetical protein